MMSMSDSVIYVPVYPKHLSAVLDLIAELVNRTEHASDEGGGTSLAPSAAASTTLWSREALEELYRRCKPLQRVIVTRVATTAAQGQSASYESLRAAMEHASGKPITFDHVRGNLAWISKYGDKITGTPAGPFKFTDHGPGKDKGVRYTCSMPKTDAEVWLAIVASAR